MNYLVTVQARINSRSEEDVRDLVEHEIRHLGPGFSQALVEIVNIRELSEVDILTMDLDNATDALTAAQARVLNLTHRLSATRDAETVSSSTDGN